MISSSRSTAEGFSSLAMMRARSPIRSRASMMSSGRCTGQRDPVGAQRQRRVQVAQVAGVSAEIGSTTPGTLTPLRSDSRPPTSTGYRAGRVAGVDAQRERPSSSSSSAPGASAAKISGWGRQTRSALPGRGSGQAEALAGLQLHRPLREGAHAQRGLGSAITPMGRPVSASISRRMAMRTA